MRNLAAWTPPGSAFPPYLSINDNGTGVSITIRDAKGIHAQVDLTYEEWDRVADQLEDRSGL